MPIASDEEIRALALATVRQLQDRYCGRVPSAALSEGITVRGVLVPIWNYQRGIFKPAALAGC